MKRFIFLLCIFLLILLVAPLTFSLTVTSFGSPQPNTEPATMLLLGIVLISLAGIGRKKFFKSMVK